MGTRQDLLTGLFTLNVELESYHAVSTLPRILVLGNAHELAETRRMVLERAGFAVKVAHSPKQMAEFLKVDTFELLILCHSLSLLECESALSEARALSPEMKRLILSSGYSVRPGSEHDSHLTSFASPQALIAAASTAINHFNPAL